MSRFKDECEIKSLREERRVFASFEDYFRHSTRQNSASDRVAIFTIRSAGLQKPVHRKQGVSISGYAPRIKWKHRREVETSIGIVLEAGIGTRNRGRRWYLRLVTRHLAARPNLAEVFELRVHACARNDRDVSSRVSARNIAQLHRRFPSAIRVIDHSNGSRWLNARTVAKREREGENYSVVNFVTRSSGDLKRGKMAAFRRVQLTG